MTEQTIPDYKEDIHLLDFHPVERALYDEAVLLGEKGPTGSALEMSRVNDHVRSALVNATLKTVQVGA